MVDIIFICVITAFLCAGVYIYGVYEYDNYIEHLANYYTFDEINKRIEIDEEDIKNNDLKGEVLETVLVHLAFWKEVRDCKEKLGMANYEDIVS